MTTYRKQIWISAPPEAVFAALDTPETWSIVMPAILEPEVEETDGDGYRLEYVHKIAGIRVNGSLETSDYVPEERHVFELGGAKKGTYAFEISEQGTGTRVAFTADYSFSNAVLNRVLRRFAIQYSNRQFESMLANLKDHVEIRHRADDEEQAVA